MNTKTLPTPDLLGEVISRLKKCTPKEIDALAVECGVTSMTVKNIRDARPGRLGPSYNVVVQLHQILQSRKN